VSILFIELFLKVQFDFIYSKGFFRRSIKERAPGRYKCMDNGTCEINVSTRNGCRYCRFQRCIKVGMSVEGNLNHFS
jgi:C4 type zinc finger protein